MELTLVVTGKCPPFAVGDSLSHKPFNVKYLYGYESDIGIGTTFQTFADGVLDIFQGPPIDRHVIVFREFDIEFFPANTTITLDVQLMQDPPTFLVTFA
jgi:hypothetical protein